MINPKDVHLFNGAELLDYLTQLELFDISDFEEARNNWFKENVTEIHNIRIQDFFVAELKDGNAVLEFKVRATLDMKNNVLITNFIIN